MIEEEHHGGCLCGSVRYTVIGHPKPTGVCHCRYCQLRTGSAFGVLAYFDPDKFRLDKGELSHYNFKSESDKNWDIYFCPICGTTVYYNLESWGPLIGIDAGTFDPPTFWFDILGEVFTKAKAPFIGEIKAGQHNETFPGYRTVNEQEGRLMSSATEEE